MQEKAGIDISNKCKDLYLKNPQRTFLSKSIVRLHEF